MAVNYTPEMVDTMKQRYSANPTRETVEELTIPDAVHQLYFGVVGA